MLVIGRHPVRAASQFVLLPKATTTIEQIQKGNTRKYPLYLEADPKVICPPKIGQRLFGGIIMENTLYC